jgi:threonylcarbamoyladenosine tRNA methylthiotransferase MtaB
MTTFSIENFGCRATDADATLMRESLIRRGFLPAGKHANAEVVVLNTCTVTASADAQAREVIRKLHRENPSTRIIVTGCYAQRSPEELASLAGVTAVVGNAHQSEIADVAFGVRPFAASDVVPLDALGADAMSLSRGAAKILTSDIFSQADIRPARADSLPGDRTRPILKIQDGCNQRCSYCVIPFVRGRSRSLAPLAVLEQVERLVKSGAREIVLSGINLGSYGRDLSPRTNLVGIVKRILEETSLEQLRLSSIEPQDVTEDLAGLVASSTRIAPHFHLPLQSGSDRILDAMHRRYRAAHYAARVGFLEGSLPGVAIGADVIVGFPGETAEDFQASVDFIERSPLCYLHVFSFSARPGTKAETREGAVAPREIRDRARLLRALSGKKSIAFRRAQAGRAMRALTLGRRGEGWTEALTGNYLRVRIAGELPPNTWVNLHVPERPEEPAAPEPPASRVTEVGHD